VVDDRDKRTRRCVGSRRLKGMHTGMESRKETTQEKGKTKVLTVGRRCRRRRLDGDGGTAWMKAAAPDFSFCFGLPALARASFSREASGQAAPVHGQPLAAARRRRRGARPLPPRLHSPSSLAVVLTGKGGNPKAGWWKATATPGSPYRVSVKAVRG
jgi:hypothetical protein